MSEPTEPEQLRQRPTRTEKRVRSLARRYGYRLRRDADGSYTLTAQSGVPFFWEATLTKVDNFLRKSGP
jgi:hypothetical protein